MFSEKYKHLQLLGEGAFGAAYLVQQKANPSIKHVAKEIRISHLTPKQKEAAFAESDVLRKMSHSNIIAYIDCFLEDRTLYIVMEYADGGDLASKIKDRKEQKKLFEERTVMFFFVQVALALDHIHSRKILHRDLKPLNIFLMQKGIVKLGDFGIAKVLESTTAGAQTCIGTPAYLSPEICNNEAYGIKSDLWSLGVVTYETAALHTPFAGISVPAIALKIMGVDPDPLPEAFSQEFEWIVMQLLEKEPDRRPHLSKLIRLPYVQKHLKDLLAYTNQYHSGGCEDIYSGHQEEKHRDTPAKHEGGHSPSRGSSRVHRGEHRRDDRDCDRIEHCREFEEEKARYETERERRHREGQERFRRQREEMNEGARQHHRYLAQYGHENYLQNKELAAQVKHRAEAARDMGDVLAYDVVVQPRRGAEQRYPPHSTESRHRHYAEENQAGAEQRYPPHSTTSRHRYYAEENQGGPDQRYHPHSTVQQSRHHPEENHEEVAEAHKKEVLERGKKQREQQAEQRKRELEIAMRERDEEQRRLNEKNLRRKREEEGVQHPEERMQHPEDSAKNLALEVTVTADTIKMDATLDLMNGTQAVDAQEDHVETVALDSTIHTIIGDTQRVDVRCNSASPDSMNGSFVATVQEDRALDSDRDSEDRQDCMHQGSGLMSFNFTEKVKPKPKLSSSSSRRLQSEGEATDSFASSRSKSDTIGRALEGEDDSVHSEEGGLCIPFNDKVRPMPKLSSSTRPARRARTDVARSELRELKSEPPTDRTSRERDKGHVSSRSRVSSGPPEASSKAAVARKQGGARCSSDPPRPLGTTKRSSSLADNPNQEHRQASPTARQDNGSVQRLPRHPPRVVPATGTPASWLRSSTSTLLPGEETEKCVVEDAHRHNVAPQLPELDPTNTVLDWSISSGSSTIRQPLPTPQGGGDVSQMQDALRNALCPIQGITKILEVPTGSTFRHTSSKSPPLESLATGVSIRSELNLSESEDER